MEATTILTRGGVYGVRSALEMSGGIEVKQIDETERGARIAHLLGLAEKRRADEEAGKDLA